MAQFTANGKLTLDKVCFNSEQFEKALKESNKGDSIILDESFDVANRRQSQSTANMRVLSLLQMMRHKRVFIYLVLPCIFDLDKNVILNLCDLFIHCYRPEHFGKRGYFKAYNVAEIKKLWLYGRQSMSYSPKYSYSNFHGKFGAYVPWDSDEYDKKKMKAIETSNDKSKLTENQRYKLQRNKIIKGIRDTYSVAEIEEISGLKKRTIYDILNKEEGETNGKGIN